MFVPCQHINHRAMETMRDTREGLNDLDMRLLDDFVNEGNIFPFFFREEQEPEPTFAEYFKEEGVGVWGILKVREGFIATPLFFC